MSASKSILFFSKISTTVIRFTQCCRFDTAAVADYLMCNRHIYARCERGIREFPASMAIKKSLFFYKKPLDIYCLCGYNNRVATEYSSIAQSVERMTVNHDVVGSSPTGGAKKTTCFDKSFFHRYKFLTEFRFYNKCWGQVMNLTPTFIIEPIFSEFNDCIKAYRNWFNEIVNSMDVPWTNGFIEGCNNKTKALKRVCFGMRNFHNFRNRILFSNA